MLNAMTPAAAPAAVVDEAAAVVAATVRTRVATALRAATGCGCHQCRVRGVRTFQWADALLPSAGSAGRRGDGHGESAA